MQITDTRKKFFDKKEIFYQPTVAFQIVKTFSNIFQQDFNANFISYINRNVAGDLKG